MLEISSKTNLLEQKSYKYSLQDIADPNLQRDIYSYGTVPAWADLTESFGRRSSLSTAKRTVSPWKSVWSWI